MTDRRRWTPLLTSLLLLLVLIAGCGKSNPAANPPTVTRALPAPAVTFIPPESSITPEGARPAPAPPVRFGLGPAVKHIDAAGLRLIESFEGYQRCAYWDPFGGVYTAGFGQTRGIYRGFCFASLAAATQNLAQSIEREYAWSVRALGYPFDQHEFDALLSFAYNLGGGIFTGVLREDLGYGRFYAAAAIMRQYDHAGGVVLLGLERRRLEETSLMLTPEQAVRPVSRASRAQLLAARGHERSFLAVHHCRQPPWRHATPSGHWEHACHVVLAHGQLTNRQLKAAR